MEQDSSHLQLNDSRELISAECSLNNDESSPSDILNEEGSTDIKGCLIGVKRRTLEELHQLYKSHANALGFSFKATTTHHSKDGRITDKYFTCSCEGFSREVKKSEVKKVDVDERFIVSPIQIVDVVVDQPTTKPKRKRISVKRTGCKALIRLKYLQKEDLYFVARHVVEHNHEMTRLEWGHLKRSERSISEAKGEVIKKLEEAGIGAVDGYNVLVKAAGGEEFVGHTKKDHVNFVQNLRMEKMERGDAQTVIDRLRSLENEDKGFYYRIQFDEETRLSSIFWRDAMMKEDFDLYGDVAVFDTTYTTNKYGLICAPIVGINNHWNTVMFGCAFLPKETTQNFEWLLTEFRNSMGGKEPKTIFTDQDMAMSNAIKQVFGDRVRHRLCIWHIQQNAISHFGRLKTDEEFKETFDNCLRGCVDEIEFENCWSNMILKYNLEEESWFKRLYEIREKWCTGLNRDFFSAGILSSQRSESTNHAISFKANRTTSLTKFFDIFNAMIERWRSDEQKKEFDASYTKPRTELYGGLIRHAADVYTSEIFRYFENEAKAAFAAPFKIGLMTDWNNVMFEISHERKPEKSETVHFYKDSRDGSVNVTCSCKHFEAVGWLCFHAIKALNIANINSIPDKYIKKRWTKVVKKEVWDRTHKGLKEGESLRILEANDSLPWRQQMARKYYDLMLTCHENHIARRILEDGFTRDSLQIQAILCSFQKEGASTSTINSEDSSRQISAPAVKDPLRAITKGRQKKIKTKFERKKPIGDVFGSKPPNRHLI